jgi:hypothetical protein
LGWPQRGPLQVFSFYRGNIWSLDGVGYTSPHSTYPSLLRLSWNLSPSIFLSAFSLVSHRPFYSIWSSIFLLFSDKKCHFFLFPYRGFIPPLLMDISCLLSHSPVNISCHVFKFSLNRCLQRPKSWT